MHSWPLYLYPKAQLESFWIKSAPTRLWFCWYLSCVQVSCPLFIWLISQYFHTNRSVQSKCLWVAGIISQKPTTPSQIHSMNIVSFHKATNHESLFLFTAFRRPLEQYSMFTETFTHKGLNQNLPESLYIYIASKLSWIIYLLFL